DYKMKEINISARIRRNGLIELAGEFYCDPNSQIVKELNKKNKSALLGIQRDDGIYTVIGEESVYYLTNAGIEREISHPKLLEILKNSALKIGKKAEFEYVNINDQDSIWVLNGPTMNALWNTIL